MARKTYRRSFIREWRKHRGLTQDQLAEAVNVSKPYLSQLENGVRQWNQEVLEAIAAALRTDPGSLIHRDPNQADDMRAFWDSLTPEEKKRSARIIEAMRETG